MAICIHPKLEAGWRECITRWTHRNVGPFTTVSCLSRVHSHPSRLTQTGARTHMYRTSNPPPPPHQPYQAVTAMRPLGSIAAAAAGLFLLVACGWLAPARGQEIVAESAPLAGGGSEPYAAGCKSVLELDHVLPFIVSCVCNCKRKVWSGRLTRLFASQKPQITVGTCTSALAAATAWCTRSPQGTPMALHPLLLRWSTALGGHVDATAAW